MELHRLFQALKPQIESALLRQEFSNEEGDNFSIPVFQFEIALKQGQASGLIHSHVSLSLIPESNRAIQLPDIYQNSYLSGGIFLDRCESCFAKDLPVSSYALAFSSLILGDSPIQSGTYSLSMALNIFPETRESTDVLCLFEELTTLELYSKPRLRN